MGRDWPRIVLILTLILALSLLLNLYQLFARPRDAVVIDAFHQLAYDNQETWAANKWLGISALQNPNDVWITQEIISEVKPDLIIETGTWNGGGALLWASLLEEVNPNGRVITVDIEDGTTEAQKLPLWKRRVQFLHGRSTDPAIVAEIKRQAAGKKVMVILDSDHHKDNVVAEMKTFGPLVAPGGYMIVQDSNINGHPVLPDFGPGPWEALDEFLPEHPEFKSDRARERQLFSMHPRGYLKKSEAAAVAGPAES